ncbi:MAG: glycosyltransferase family 2 protein [Planctomycetota bacterium]|jgi:glycosyltransferase involved in cell wall biosynthesis
MSPQVLTALPVYNEESHVAEVLAEVRRYADNVLVVNDGSSDGTADVLQSIPGILVETHEQNQGYGAALKTAFCYAIRHGYDVVITIDCDGQHEPSLIPELAAAVYPEDSEPYDIVSGSRYLKQFDGDSLPPEERRRINMEITRFLNERLQLNLTDSFCGFKAYRTLAIENLNITELGYAMPLQLWVQAVDLGFRITEFPVPLVYLDEERSFGGSLDDSNRRLRYYRQVLDRELANVAAANEASAPRVTLCD